MQATGRQHSIVCVWMGKVGVTKGPWVATSVGRKEKPSDERSGIPLIPNKNEGCEVGCDRIK